MRGDLPGGGTKKPNEKTKQKAQVNESLGLCTGGGGSHWQTDLSPALRKFLEIFHFFGRQAGFKKRARAPVHVYTGIFDVRIAHSCSPAER